MESFYEAPDEALKRRRFSEYRREIIEPLFPKDPSAKILDMGAGYGLFLDACRRLGYGNIEGVEREPAFVDYARRELGLASVAQGDMLPYLESKGDGSLDVITALNIIEHVKKDRIEYLFALVRRKLRPGGIFVMEVPNADSPLGVHTYFSDLTHEFAFSKKLGLRLLATAGFERVSVCYEPNIRNPLVKIAQTALAKAFGLERDQLFSGNILFVGYR